MRVRDQIQLIEAAYALELSHLQWQYRITDLVAEHWCGVATSFVCDASRVGELFCQSFVVRRAEDRSISETVVSIPLEDQTLGRALFAARPELVRLDDLLGPGFRRFHDYESIVAGIPSLRPTDFAIALRSLSIRGRGLFFALPSRSISSRAQSMWDHVARQIEFAFRLRRATPAVRNTPEAQQLLNQALRDIGRARRIQGSDEPD